MSETNDTQMDSRPAGTADRHTALAVIQIDKKRVAAAVAAIPAPEREVA